jgi:hypothetical protein
MARENDLYCQTGVLRLWWSSETDLSDEVLGAEDLVHHASHEVDVLVADLDEACCRSRSAGPWPPAGGRAGS